MPKSLLTGALLGASLVAFATPLLSQQRAEPLDVVPMHIGATLLLPTHGERARNGSLPSGRLQFDRAVGRSLVAHIAAVRAVDTRGGTHALSGGVAYRVAAPGMELRPFAELAFGRAEVLADSGGYHYKAGGATAYQPRTRQVTGGSYGGGAGISALIPMAPWASLEVTTAHWRMSGPSGTGAISRTVVGAGLRIPVGGRRLHGTADRSAPSDNPSSTPTSDVAEAAAPNSNF